jgi:hypothetical protein
LKWKKLEIKLTGRREYGCIILAVGLALGGAACHGTRSKVTTQDEAASGSGTVSRGAALVRMNDSRTGAQLLSGFYAIENNAWRWTAGTFSVLLYTPPASAQRGAALTLAFTIPDIAIRQVGDVTLTASINGMALRSVKYDKAGVYIFTADVPPSMLTTDSVTVDFALDKSFQTNGDVRKLGVIAASVGLKSK